MLSNTGKKILLAIHLVLISVWFGSLISMLVLHFVRTDANEIYIIDRIIFTIFDKIIMNISLAVALSGMMFSLFTKWGFFKFYWITIKWIILILLAVMLMFFAAPVTNGMAAISDILRAESPGNPDYQQYAQSALKYTVVQIIFLTFIIYLSVSKPWGTRKQRFLVKRKVLITLVSLISVLLILSVLMQYQQLNYFRNLPLSGLDINSIHDGEYHASVNYGSEYRVAVQVKDHRITGIGFLQNRSGHYAKLAEMIQIRILNAQNTNVAAVTGATTTSKVLIKAVETALKGPGGE